MFRSAIAIVVLGSAAFAQIDASHKLKPITGPIRDGGTFHIATNTWTRKSAQSNVGADTVYNNTCSSGYYSPLSYDTYVDEGRVPSSSGPTDANNRPGCGLYTAIDGFQIAYCTDRTPATFGTYNVNFYQSLAACGGTIGVTPTAGFALQGLPAWTGQATIACWIVNIDLDAPPLTASLAFTMWNDGDGTFTGSAGANLFGWSMSSTAAGTSTGPFIAGDFNTCSGFDGTRWDTVINYAEQGTGMSTLDQFRIEGSGVPGCYFFGGNPLASFHLQLFADACVGEMLNVFCLGDGIAPHTSCPCGNHTTTAAGAGCMNSFGVGSAMRSAGIASISADSVHLYVNGLPATSTLIFQGTIQQNAGNGAVFGDGLRCAGGSVTRIATITATGTSGAATIDYPSGSQLPLHIRGNLTAAGIRTYQAWYRNAAAFCTNQTFNTSNGLQITWTL